MSYAVSGRVHEIGVRTALGTQRHDIFRLVVGSGMRLAAIGLALGAAAALVATRAMTSLLSAFAACYVPARRALAVDPFGRPPL